MLPKMNAELEKVYEMLGSVGPKAFFFAFELFLFVSPFARPRAAMPASIRNTNREVKNMLPINAVNAAAARWSFS